MARKYRRGRIVRGWRNHKTEGLLAIRMGAKGTGAVAEYVIYPLGRLGYQAALDALDDYAYRENIALTICEHGRWVDCPICEDW